MTRTALSAPAATAATLRPHAPTSLWPDSFRSARLHIVTGKGGTGKTTIAAALALALAQDGNKVLLIEVEERQAIAQLFDLPPLPYAERRIAVAAGGGEVHALAIDVEAALLEYFAMFYNLGFAGRTLKKMGAVEFATTIAPGLRDVLLTGKIKETVTRGSGRSRSQTSEALYDAVVVDAPPTGRVVNFLQATVAMAGLARRGPIRSQADGVVALLHSADTAVHLVTLLEDMPVAETCEAVADLAEADLPTGVIFVNRATADLLPDAMYEPVAAGKVDRAALNKGLRAVGIEVDRAITDGLSYTLTRYAQRRNEEQRCAADLAATGLPQLYLPIMSQGVELGEVYELADLLAFYGVRL